MNHVPWLSVITVVKDDSAGLLATLNSLQTQNLDGVEHVVVDSSRVSEMSSVEAFNLSTANRKFSWIDPTGIYPAMNHGLKLASGTFVYFLNAGDTFFNESVLEHVHLLLKEPPAQWAFGPVVIHETNGSTTLTPQWDYSREKKYGFSNGHFPSHQGTFAQRELLLKFGGFEVQYKVAADYAAFLNLSRIADPMIFEFPIAVFQEGGTSTTHWKQSLHEFHEARKSNLDLAGGASIGELINTYNMYLKMWIVRKILRRKQYR